MIAWLLFIAVFLFVLYKACGGLNVLHPKPHLMPSFRAAAQTSPRVSSAARTHPGVSSATRTSPELLELYFCTADDYNPDEWRVTSKTVSHTFDGGKTWLTVYKLEKTSRYTILRMEARGDVNPNGVNLLGPGERNIFLLIEEKKD